jgi:cobalt-zinc-cadmium efflux system outer membrane protein
VSLFDNKSMRPLRIVTLSTALACFMASAALAQSMPEAAPSTNLSLRQALQAASANLDVALARSNLAGAQADIVSANRAPLPTLSTKLSQMDLQNGIGNGHWLTEKRVDKSIGLDWTWERGNKRALRTQSAQQSAAAASADLQEVRTQQLLATHVGFFDLLAFQERLGHFAAIERSAAELAQAARLRVNAGDLSVQEGLRTDIEHQRARSDLQLAELDRQRAAIALWQTTGLAIPPQELRANRDWPAVGTPMPMPDLASLVQQRADVRAAESRVLAAQAALDNARALKVSDITWGASYDHYPGTSTALMELRLQMPLQWGYGFEGEIARATAQLTLAQDALEKTRRVALSELQRLQQETRNTAERARAYEQDILPRARQVAQGAELAYSKGALSLTDLLDARRTLRATLLDSLAARTDHAKAAGLWQLRLSAPETRE